MKILSILLSLAFLLSACTPAVLATQSPTASIIPAGPTSMSDPAAIMRHLADIKLEDNGKTFTFSVTTRFSIFLDDQAYPVSELKCAPSGIIGAVSNGSLRGPNLYPVMFEVVQPGQCTLTDRDYSVQIIGQ